MDTPTTPSLRERKKAQTRSIIQEQALRLFLAKGYDATTVEEIAAAAGVSHMTFFRYFPTKEDVVMWDEYDPLLVGLIVARPADEPAVEAIRHALREGLMRISAADQDIVLTRTRLALDTPALRARMWEQHGEAERTIARALAARAGEGEPSLRTHVIAAACLAATTTAVLAWAESNGALALADLVDQALMLLRDGLADTSR